MAHMSLSPPAGVGGGEVGCMKVVAGADMVGGVVPAIGVDNEPSP